MFHPSHPSHFTQLWAALPLHILSLWTLRFGSPTSKEVQLYHYFIELPTNSIYPRPPNPAGSGVRSHTGSLSLTKSNSVLEKTMLSWNCWLYSINTEKYITWKA
jgi:hypothetical protein